MLQQRTLKTLTKAVGVGLHSGQRVELTLRPAQPDTGIVFRRIDLPQPVDIPVSAQAVSDTRLASTISNGGAKVHTVEHLMSACAGLGIDNLYVDITAEEVPILDGSSASFVFLLQSAGIALQKAPRRFIRVIETVEVSEGSGDTVKWARLSPYHGYKLSFEIDFAHRVALCKYFPRRTPSMSDTATLTLPTPDFFIASSAGCTLFFAAMMSPLNFARHLLTTKACRWQFPSHATYPPPRLPPAAFRFVQLRRYSRPEMFQVW